jgi:hypothetical protein
MTTRRSAALAAAAGLMLLAAPGGAIAGQGWSRSKCQRAYIRWAHQHPTANQAQRKAYMRGLNHQGLCSFGNVGG